MEPSSSRTHIVKEQFVPEENRDIASFNADNEFNRATDEENIDFNIPGVPNSTVKRSHGTEAHREYADYRNPEGVSVSQSSLSVAFDRTGKPSFGFRNTYKNPR